MISVTRHEKSGGGGGPMAKQAADHFTLDLLDKPKRGRPRKPDAMTDAQRARAYRARKRALEHPDFRCPSCRTRRRDYGLFTQHLKTTGHALCKCGGYHYAHRPGSPFCVSNAMSDVRLADRQGEPDDVLADIAAWCAFNKPGRVATACPF